MRSLKSFSWKPQPITSIPSASTAMSDLIVKLDEMLRGIRADLENHETGSGAINHTKLSNIGVNTHAQVDTHIADSTKHFTVGSIDHGSISGLGDDDHTTYHTDGRAATWLAANHETTYTHSDIALNTTHRTSTGADHSYIDQAVTVTATPTFAGLTVTGGNIRKIATKTADYTVLATDYTLLANHATVAITFTLPASPVEGQIHNLKNINNATLTIARNGNEIDGGTSDITVLINESYTLQADESGNWWVI